MDFQCIPNSALQKLKSKGRLLDECQVAYFTPDILLTEPYKFGFSIFSNLLIVGIYSLHAVPNLCWIFPCFQSLYLILFYLRRTELE